MHYKSLFAPPVLGLLIAAILIAGALANPAPTTAPSGTISINKDFEHKG